MLPSVLPLVQRWSFGPVWDFADRNQIINVCSGHDEYTWFFRPVSPTVAPYPPSTGERLRRPQVRRAYALAATVVIRALIGIGVPVQSDNCVSELIIELERIFLSEQ
jgi:hypothetical protein